MKWNFGPGAMVASAFIGPGTVTACTVAGARFGYDLLWALVLATLAAIALQEMTARLGAGARRGLGETLMAAFPGRAGAGVAAALVIAAVAGGAAAYEAGNLTGAALGVEAAFAGLAPDRRVIAVLFALAAAGLLLLGNYKAFERVLVAAAGLMSAAFLLAAVLARPDLGAVFGGLVPAAPTGSALTIAALIGTTVVPYNLFLHAAAARERWAGGPGDVAEARGEAALSISIGGAVSLAIVTCAAAVLFGSGRTVESAADMAAAIEPVFGPFARVLVGLGLTAAGLTSAVTAPMAAGFAAGEIFGRDDARRRRTVFRLTAGVVLLVGAVAAVLGARPVALILLAQTANGLLLPVVAVFLLIAMNRRTLLGDHVNGPLANAVGGLVVTLAVALGLRTLAAALGFWG